MCTFARVVGAARDKTHESFSARGGKKVVHHCSSATPLFVMQINPFWGFLIDVYTTNMLGKNTAHHWVKYQQFNYWAKFNH